MSQAALCVGGVGCRRAEPRQERGYDWDLVVGGQPSRGIDPEGSSRTLPTE